jgi:hypothetical protein
MDSINDAAIKLPQGLGRSLWRRAVLLTAGGPYAFWQRRQARIKPYHYRTPSTCNGGT